MIEQPISTSSSIMEGLILKLKAHPTISKAKIIHKSEIWSSRRYLSIVDEILLNFVNGKTIYQYINGIKDTIKLFDVGTVLESLLDANDRANKSVGTPVNKLKELWEIIFENENEIDIYNYNEEVLF